MRISDWVQTCALPIYLVSRYEVCDFSVCPLSRLSTASSDVPQSVRSLSWILLTEISRRPGATVSIVVPVDLVSTFQRLPFSRPMRPSPLIRKCRFGVERVKACGRESVGQNG